MCFELHKACNLYMQCALHAQGVVNGLTRGISWLQSHLALRPQSSRSLHKGRGHLCVQHFHGHDHVQLVGLVWPFYLVVMQVQQAARRIAQAFGVCGFRGHQPA